MKLRNSKKARPDAATSRQAKQGNHWASGNPYGQSNTQTTGRQFKIAALLMVGKENGLRLSDLVRLLDWPERDVRREIQFERLHGVPILSDCQNGYFLPETEEERAACVRSLRGRAQEILSVADAISAAEVD